MRNRKRWVAVLGLVLIISLALSAIFLKAPIYYQARSYLVMSVFSLYEKMNSLLDEQKIVLDIPGGLSTEEKDWYPFVMTFNADQGFSRYMGRDLRLTILYNFGSFNWRNASSTFFIEGSRYFNSFYGAYVVKEEDPNKKYGFAADGSLNIEEVFKLAEYDYKYLVLKSFGCPDDKLTMDILSYDLMSDVSYAGYDGWTRIDSMLLLNSPVHKYKGERRAYIQYGNPHQQEKGEEFKLMTSQGRIYARYFPEFQCSVFLYILSPELTTIEECDEQILSKTVISLK